MAERARRDLDARDAQPVRVTPQDPVPREEALGRGRSALVLCYSLDANAIRGLTELLAGLTRPALRAAG